VPPVLSLLFFKRPRIKPFLYLFERIHKAGSAA
jgi:hypothetical protein